MSTHAGRGRILIVALLALIGLWAALLSMLP